MPDDALRTGGSCSYHGSMADLVVDLVALQDLGDRLDRIKAGLDSSRRTIDGHDEDYGSPRVRDAMRHFEGHWRDGRRHVEDTAGTLAAMAHDAVDGFTRTDTALADRLRAATRGRPGQPGQPA